MPRFCSRCNRPLTPEFHDTARVAAPTKRGRGRVGIMMRRVYGCRMKLVFTTPSGKDKPATHHQRTKHTNTRWVHDNTKEKEHEAVRANEDV